MAKKNKKAVKKKSGGARPGSGPKTTPEDKKVTINFSLKNKLVDSSEKKTKLKDAVYQFVKEVYEKNV